MKVRIAASLTELLQDFLRHAHGIAESSKTGVIAIGCMQNMFNTLGSRYTDSPYNETPKTMIRYTD